MINKKRELNNEMIPPLHSLERRDVPRFNIKNINLPIVIDDGEKEYKVAGTVLDISERGLLIKIQKKLQLYERINFSIDWPHTNASLEGTGRVIRHFTGSNVDCYGIAYQSKDVDIEKLKQYLAEHKDQLELINRRKEERRKEQKGVGANDLRKNERRNICTIFQKCIRFNRLEEVQNKSFYLYQREVQGGADRRILRSGKWLVNFASNNYLSLATHPFLKAAAIKAIKKYGLGTTGARLLNGTTDLHTALEQRLAEFTGGEACMVCTTGFSLNISIIRALATPDTHVIIDNKVHASLVDGCFLSPAKIVIFKHNDQEDLKQKLMKLSALAPKLIVLDGVYSMKGDTARLDEIYELSQKHQAALMIDDAHGIGILGKTGRGTPERFGLVGKIDLYVGTLSKALGCMGGFIVAKEKIIQYLKHNTRSFIFSTSLPTGICASTLKALEIIEKEPERRERLIHNVNYLKRGLLYLGFNIENTESAIVPLNINNEELTYRLGYFLEQEGIYVNAFAYPAVKKGEAGLRISLQANHTEQDLDYFIEKMEKAKKHLELEKKEIDLNYN